MGHRLFSFQKVASSPTTPTTSTEEQIFMAMTRWNSDLRDGGPTRTCVLVGATFLSMVVQGYALDNNTP